MGVAPAGDLCDGQRGGRPRCSGWSFRILSFCVIRHRAVFGLAVVFRIVRDYDRGVGSVIGRSVFLVYLVDRVSVAGPFCCFA